MQSEESRLSVDRRVTATMDVCDHCGLPAPVRQGTELTFCCAGCRGAYQLIHHWGLEDYYALRDRLMSGDNVEAVSNQPKLNWDELAEHDLLGASTPHDIGNGMVCSRLAIEGVHCGACVWLIERMATTIPGWQAARVGLHDHSVEVTYDPQTIKLGDIATNLAAIGYQVSPWVEGTSEARYRAENRKRLVQIAIAGFCAMNAMWIAIGIYAGEFSGIATSQWILLRCVGVALGLIAAFGPGREFFKGALAALRTRTPHMDLPIAIGVGVGAIAGLFSLFFTEVDVYFDSVAVLVFLLLVGRWIQFRQQHRAASAVSLLMRMTPSLAVKIGVDGAHHKTPVHSLQRGDRLYVSPGEAIPVDGEIIAGRSAIDRSLMTGESRPVTVEVGQTVDAGALNLQSPLTIMASASLQESRITKLMRLVEEASLTRTPIVQLADSIAARFIITVVCLAIATLLFWWQRDWLQATSHTVALLIVACPCALALATPLAIAVTLGRAAKQKLLIRSGETLERLAKAGTIWFDKTGTLTAGRPQIITSIDNDEALRLVASLESQSTHPLARAIVDEALRRKLLLGDLNEVQNVEQVPGGGMRGVVRGRFVSAGNVGFITKAVMDFPASAQSQVQDIADRGATPVVVAVDGEVVAVLGIGDAIRPSAVATIKSLQDRGWKVGILSGDHPAAVSTVCERLGIDAVRGFGNLTPEQKLAMIGESKLAGGTVVMVGDGINDAAALAAADVGIAVRGGAEASLQAAPVYLGSNQLEGITRLIDASQRTVQTIRRNFFVSLFYNSIAVSLAMTGLISPLIAAILMPISSLSILSLTLSSRTFPDSSTHS